MTQIRYPGQHLLNGRQRGYREPGKRLLPRDAHDAYEITSMKLHGLRELQAQRIAESKAYGPDPCRTAQDFDPFASALRKLNALSGRKRKLAEALGYTNGTPPQGAPRSIRRVVEAMVQAERIELCVDHDQKMLANAY